LNIFFENSKKIEQHNAAVERARLQGGSNKAKKMLFTLGTNKYADRTPAEIEEMNGFRVPQEELRKKRQITVTPTINATLPAAVDWRNVPCVVTAVKDQGLSHCIDHIV
jgi:hypothetical protein